MENRRGKIIITLETNIILNFFSLFAIHLQRFFVTIKFQQIFKLQMGSMEMTFFYFSDMPTSSEILGKFFVNLIFTFKIQSYCLQYTIKLGIMQPI